MNSTSTGHTDFAQVFSDYYERDHPHEMADPEYAWHPTNPKWIAVRQERERIIIGFLRSSQIDLQNASILEIGSGNGLNLRFFLELGASRGSTFGVDILPARLALSKAINPSLGVVRADAGHLPFPSGAFDLVSQFVAFSSMSRTTRALAAREAVRVLRPGGHVLWYDVRRPRPGEIPDGVDDDELATLFPSVTWTHTARLHSLVLPRIARYPFLSATLTRLPIVPRTNVVMLGEHRVSGT